MKTRHNNPNGHSEETEDIQAGIEQTRAEMDHTLDEISERLQPRHLLDDLLDYFRSRRQSGHHDGHRVKEKASRAASHVKESAGDVGRVLIDEVKRNPVPSLLIGAGVAWLLANRGHENDGDGGYYSAIDPEYENTPGYDLSESVEGGAPESYALPEHYSEQQGGTGGVMGKMKGAGASLKSKAGDGLGKARRKTAATAQALREKASAKGAQLSAGAHHTYEEGVVAFKRASNDHPLAVGVGFLALGVLAGMLLPSTRKEDELVGPTRDRLVQRSRDAAEDAVNRGKKVAYAAADAVKSEAQAQGLNPEKLKQKAAHIMESAKSVAREEGLTPGGLKEKVQAVAAEAKDTTREEAKKQQHEMSQV